ncbi:MAG: ATP-binding protein [Oscillospiraceae bacterium]|jgi:predicted AAA+ superfamily ATPase|nr:ATP-binding protein [Oscillospiraceae bacterium]
MYLKRHIEEAILRREKAKGAIVVTGARQVGKTTLIENLKPEITKVTLDDLPTRHRAIDAPSTFFNLTPPPIFVDEIQYAPELFHYVKILLDISKKKGDFYLTGSQSFELMKNVTESLAGRAGILELFGLSMREINNEEWKQPFLPTFEYLTERKTCITNMQINEIWTMIHRGSLPELALNPEFEWADFYSDYIKSYIERDVRNLTQVADESSFYTFMTVCAAMSGQLLNLSSLANDVGVSVPTAKRWLSVLKTSGIIYLLKPYTKNVIKRAVKMSKLYFLDIGLASYLTRWMTSDNLAIGANNGNYFESFVVSEILKSYTNAGKEVDMYFLRDSNKKEIDLLIHENNTLYPIEIKIKAEPTQKDLKAFEMLDNIKGVNIGEGGIICLANNLLQLDEKNYIIPLSMI